MNNSVYDVIVIGAGHAGLCISYNLKQAGLSHTVLERYRIGSTWALKRWDSFKLNSANKINGLPGFENFFPDEDAFATAHEFVSFLNHYATTFELPVSEGSNVLSVEKNPASGLFLITFERNGQNEIYKSWNVVVASGAQNESSIPFFANNISKDVIQLHACEYRNAHLLPPGNVLVAGSAQSGTQIAEDLIGAGRKVFLSTSKVARIPRRYRGKDIMDWLLMIGFYDQLTDDVTDPEIFKLKPPQVSGVGLRGKTSSLQELAQLGAIVTGRMTNAGSLNLYFQMNASDHVRFADEFSLKVKKLVDDYIVKSNMIVPLTEYDAADITDENAVCVTEISSLNLKEHNISSIIWATGFKGNFNYIKLPVFKEDGTLKHRNGISEVSGLYFLALPWMRKRKSSVIAGIQEDASFITDNIKTRLHEYSSTNPASL